MPNQPTGPSVPPGAGGLDPAVVAAHVEPLVARAVRPDDPGVAVLVLADGRRAYAAGHGMADLENGLPITPQTPFDLASVSKQFTALAVLRLADRGLVDLDGPAEAWLPGLPTAPGHRPLGVSDLLWHTSGLPDYLDLVPQERLPGMSNADLPALLLGRALDFAPGTRHEYVNTNYALLPLLVERSSGVPFARFLREELFAPLGMTTTAVLEDPARAPAERACGYQRGRWRWRLCECLCTIAGDGGLWSNLDDLERWLVALLDNRAALLRPATWARMFTPGKFEDGEEFPYGFGVRVQTYRGWPVWGHGGNWTGFSHYLGRYGGGRLGVAVLGNRRGLEAEDLADAIADGLLPLLGTPL
jgi:CubicO group peptidase (beta-lactamase class C family)